MGRRLRVWESGRCYHLILKAISGRELFYDDRGRDFFMSYFEKVDRDYELTTLGYSLMDTHVHMLVEAGTGNISKAIQVLQGRYASWWNEEYGQRGHLFVNHFYDKAIRDEAHLWATARYIDLNPVVAGKRERPEDWRWSSYRGHVGLEHAPSLLANHEFLKHFGSTPATAQLTYRRLVEAELKRVLDARMADTLGLRDNTSRTGTDD
jgi:putative transposase